MNKNEILKKLRKNRTKNISIIGIIENYGLKEIFQAFKNGVYRKITDQPYKGERLND